MEMVDRPLLALVSWQAAFYGVMQGLHNYKAYCDG